MIPVISEIKYKGDPSLTYSIFSEDPYSFFLDSGMDPGKLGRFSFIGADPFLILRSRGRQSFVDCQGWRKDFRGNPLYILKDLLRRYECPFRTPEFPFWGGAVGWFSYDLKDQLEKVPDTARRDLDIPECAIGFYDCVLIFDNLKKRAFIASSGFPETGKRQALRAKARLERMKDVMSLRGGVNIRHCESRLLTGRSNLYSTFSKEQYIRTILKAKEYISAGDIYQVNLSQRFHADFDGDAFGLYLKLRAINPAPFAAYLNFGETKVASSSPERFMKISARSIQTRPIKGTRPRGRTAFEDSELKNELITSEKDRAENLMIIDLERNDIGRISEYGSVRVSEFMVCEEYPTVFQLTSAVEGKLKKGLGPCDMLANCFPGGSITGAPKIRSMEIIEELEPVKRSLYTGSIGYIGFNGDMDSSIIIRTFIIKGTRAYFGVGGGIVYDSDPEKEYEETLHKARALIEALKIGTAPIFHGICKK